MAIEQFDHEGLSCLRAVWSWRQSLPSLLPSSSQTHIFSVWLATLSWNPSSAPLPPQINNFIISMPPRLWEVEKFPYKIKWELFLLFLFPKVTVLKKYWLNHRLTNYLASIYPKAPLMSVQCFPFDCLAVPRLTMLFSDVSHHTGCWISTQLLTRNHSFHSVMTDWASTVCQALNQKF